MSDEPFNLPLPSELAEAIRQRQDRAHMAADAEAARVDAFLSGLDVDGLLALRFMLNTGDCYKSCTANFWDGQIVSILRYVHKVDPETGKDPLAADDLPTEGPGT